MRPLYLLRHASPILQPNAPQSEWTLSERGIAEAQQLAEMARGWGLRAVYTSAETKAKATALIIAEACGLNASVVDGLEELRFDEWIANSNQFSEAVRDILAKPDVAMRGAERAAAAAARFAAAVSIIEQGPFPAAAVSHGRVMTAYLAETLRLPDPFGLWRAMPMPAWAVLDLDGPRLAGEFRGLPQ